MDSDWLVWPIFVTQLVAFLLFFFKTRARFLWIPIHTWIIIFIVAIDISIVASLIHDSDQVLHLYF